MYSSRVIGIQLVAEKARSDGTLVYELKKRRREDVEYCKDDDEVEKTQEAVTLREFVLLFKCSSEGSWGTYYLQNFI